MRVRSTPGGFRQHWREVMGTFLKIGSMSYGGAASVGIMQTEVLEKRAWIPKGTVYRGAGAGKYLARSWRGPAGDLFRLHARRVVGRYPGRTLFHPARVLYPAGLDPGLSPLWRTAEHASSLLWTEPSGGGDLRDVGVPAGPGGGSRSDASPAGARQRSGPGPHGRWHRPHDAPGRCRRRRALRLVHLGYRGRAGHHHAVWCLPLGERVGHDSCLHWPRLSTPP